MPRIEIVNPMWGTISVVVSLDEGECKLLAGDIENWLLARKGIVCDYVKVNK